MYAGCVALHAAQNGHSAGSAVNSCTSFCCKRLARLYTAASAFSCRCSVGFTNRCRRGPCDREGWQRVSRRIGAATLFRKQARAPHCACAQRARRVARRTCVHCRLTCLALSCRSMPSRATLACNRSAACSRGRGVAHRRGRCRCAAVAVVKAASPSSTERLKAVARVRTALTLPRAFT